MLVTSPTLNVGDAMPHFDDQPSTLSAITFNTWNCQGDYARRVELMETEFADLAPDIVLLQEVFSADTGDANTAKVLARHLGMNVAYHAARSKTRTRNDEPIACSSGLALLSRPAIVWSERVALPQDHRDGERIAQFAEIRVGRERLLIVNLHLTHLAFAENLRRNQLECIVERIERTWDHDHILLGGDFNAPESNPLFGTLSSGTALIATRAASERPIGLGVDHLFAISRARARPLSITSAQAVLDKRDRLSGVSASDHAGVMATIAFDDSRPACNGKVIRESQ